MDPQHRRRVVADAALAVLAGAGSRGLTHRAVDAHAGLPTGSTSYYHRSRSALLTACVQRLVELDLADLDGMAPLVTAGDPDELADAMGVVLLGWLTGDRTRHLARYELSLEAVRRPELAAELHRGGAEIRGRVADVLAGFGAPEPGRQAALLVACVDGILFDGVAGAGAGAPVHPAVVRDAVRSLVRVAVAHGSAAADGPQGGLGAAAPH